MPLTEWTDADLDTEIDGIKQCFRDELPDDSCKSQLALLAIRMLEEKIRRLQPPG